jgi:MSHA biogenesis protein MshJ
MIERLAWIQAWFDARSLRERLVLAGACVIGLLLVIEALAWAPARQRLKAAASQMASLDEQRATLQQQLDLLDQQEALDPDAAVRKQIETFDHQVGTLDEKLRAQAIQLLAPDQTRAMLHALIANLHGLKMVGLQTEAPRPLVNTEGLDLPALYRHGVDIDLQGDYLALIDYVQALEQMPWRLYWYGLEIRTDGAGARTFRLQLYTVSLYKEWIRV